MLDALPLVFVLIGLVLYTVLAGADFGAGIWTLVSRRDDQRLRDEARHAMGPVWEANHVWLIFVIVVAWTAYPTALASITSTLAIPLFIAVVGIILRGTAYALRAQQESGAVATRIERVFGVSSILTPFALGATIGAVASGRVPVGNARGDLVTSWLNPTGITIGVLGVATSWDLASVYLAADAQRGGDPDFVAAFRVRALGTGILAGALAVVGLVVVHSDAPRLWDGLTSGLGLVAIAVSALSGMTTLVLVRAGRSEPARAAAALAVAAVVAGWAIAQSPDLLPGLTVQQAAAGHATMVAVLIAVAGGAIILAPSLGLLFRLTLAGRFDHGTPAGASAPEADESAAPALRVALTAGLLVAGAILAVMLDSTLGIGLGVLLLIAFIVVGFRPLALPPDAE
jgi:cytochrome d ubiquinol oxidase subunit II